MATNWIKVTITFSHDSQIKAFAFYGDCRRTSSAHPFHWGIPVDRWLAKSSCTLSTNQFFIGRKLILLSKFLCPSSEFFIPNRNAPERISNLDISRQPQLLTSFPLFLISKSIDSFLWILFTLSKAKWIWWLKSRSMTNFNPSGLTIQCKIFFSHRTLLLFRSKITVVDTFQMWKKKQKRYKWECKHSLSFVMWK